MSDPKFEELDFLSQLTEPFETEKTQLISLLPDEIEVLPVHYKASYNYRALKLDTYDLIRSLISSVSDKVKVEQSWDLMKLIRDKYSFKFEDSLDNVLIDIEANIFPKLKLVKKDSYIDDKIATADITGIYNTMLYDVQYTKHDRIRDICEVLLSRDHEHYRQVVRQRRRINKKIAEDCFRSFNDQGKITSRFRSTQAMSNFTQLILSFVNDAKYHYRVCDELKRVKDLIDSGTPIYTVRSLDELK